MTSDFGRIHRRFHAHPKVTQAGLEAVGLWTVCNSYSRDQRTRGFISFLVAEGFDPTGAVAARLVEAKLWVRDDERGGYVFNDWLEWNGDEEPKSNAAKLVASIVKGHPSEVTQKLQGHVSDLLLEGTEWDVIRAALKMWLTKGNAPPKWLPLLVSDVLRQRQDGELVMALRQAFTTGTPAPLARFGLIFTTPDIPREVTGDAVGIFYRDAVREWVKAICKEKGIE